MSSLYFREMVDLIKWKKGPFKIGGLIKDIKPIDDGYIRWHMKYLLDNDYIRYVGQKKPRVRETMDFATWPDDVSIDDEGNLLSEEWGSETRELNFSREKLPDDIWEKKFKKGPRWEELDKIQFAHISPFGGGIFCLEKEIRRIRRKNKNSFSVCPYRAYEKCANEIQYGLYYFSVLNPEIFGDEVGDYSIESQWGRLIHLGKILENMRYNYLMTDKDLQYAGKRIKEVGDNRWDGWKDEITSLVRAKKFWWFYYNIIHEVENLC